MVAANSLRLMSYRGIGSPGDGPDPYSAKHTGTARSSAGDRGSYWSCHGGRTMRVSPLKKITHSKEATRVCTFCCSGDLSSRRTNQVSHCRHNLVTPWEKSVLGAVIRKAFCFGIFHHSSLTKPLLFHGSRMWLQQSIATIASLDLFLTTIKNNL